MARTLIVLAAFLTLAVPAALAAPPADKGKSAAAPGQSADKNAAKKCKAERASLGVDAFKLRYGNKANAFGKCVSSQVKKADEAEVAEAKENAAKKCKAERALDADAFKNTYGTNANKANAFGKCVSKLAKAQTS